jgi:hypothetical protein
MCRLIHCWVTGHAISGRGDHGRKADRRAEPAADCARDHVFEMLFSACPLPVTGSVGGPINPIAVK